MPGSILFSMEITSFLCNFLHSICSFPVKMGIKNPPRATHCTLGGYFNRISAFPLVRICRIALYGVKSLFPHIFRISSIASRSCYFRRFARRRSLLVIHILLVFSEKGRLPLSCYCPRLVRGKTRSSILACGRAMPIVRYSVCAAVRLWRCPHEPAPSCCHPTPCEAI